jgi:hypothetical protein
MHGKTQAASPSYIHDEPRKNTRETKLHPQFLTSLFIEWCTLARGDVHQLVDENASHPHAQQRCPFLIILNVLGHRNSSRM